MYIGKFQQQMNTTRDTVRYYMEQKLLHPKKKNGNYWFEEQEIADFEAILELKAMGFSISTIRVIKENRAKLGCNTKDQHQENLKLVESELQNVSQKIEAYRQQKKHLETTKVLLEQSLFLKK
ncbi:MerR family transcriptional regulator [Vagococcus entomophilus]|uniref:HTH merR-type domain-containing protein n=1 Tax=Vagococcus entomophilus TaxID=1160095 RepID=A0A430AGY5_9ENTE|nr:MerR family transcriptional regulator [Vagococcus entomophilus]RSU07143.1 hypothetical protein CBF30_07765 [Vagococcus entomophilus]